MAWLTKLAVLFGCWLIRTIWEFKILSSLGFGNFFSKLVLPLSFLSQNSGCEGFFQYPGLTLHVYVKIYWMILLKYPCSYPWSMVQSGKKRNYITHYNLLLFWMLLQLYQCIWELNFTKWKNILQFWAKIPRFWGVTLWRHCVEYLDS